MNDNKFFFWFYFKCLEFFWARKETKNWNKKSNNVEIMVLMGSISLRNILYLRYVVCLKSQNYHISHAPVKMFRSLSWMIISTNIYRINGCFYAPVIVAIYCVGIKKLASDGIKKNVLVILHILITSRADSVTLHMHKSIANTWSSLNGK